MIAIALNRTWQQLLHPKFRGVFLISVFAAMVTLAGLNYALYAYWPRDWSSGWDWFDSLGLISKSFWPVAAVSSWLLFPAVVTMVMGTLTDRIADAVEEEYYPHRIGPRNVPFLEGLWSGAKLAGIMILLNLIALIPYLLLLFMTAGTGTAALFIALNGYLLGREYFEMVALRHMSLRDAEAMRNRHSGKIFWGGALIAGLFLIPFVNILAPIVGASVMTHIFQHLKAGDPR